MVDWEKYFDHIYILSRAKNIESRNELVKELKRINLSNYHWWYNCDNMLIDYNRYRKDIDTAFDDHVIRCTFGQYSLIKTAYELGWEDILIFEDDVRFLKDINEIENQLNIFLENKNIIDGYFFDYLHFKTGLIELSSGFYINRKLMEYLIYCMEHYHLAIDNYIPEHLLYPNDCINIFYDYLYKFDGYVTEHIDIPSEILPIQIMLSPKLLCIQPDKIDQYLGKFDHIKQKSIQDSNEYNLI